MPEEAGMQDMVTLKTIAETLNTSNDLSLMLDTVVGKLLELTGLTAGWLFLIDERGEYTCISDYNLPPALMRRDKEPMRVGTCWCVNRFRDGRLQHAVNIINCKRLEDAVEFKWGDTQDITHHATVPLRSGERMLGLLNVAAPGKEHFSDSELALLQAVAYQIGSAMERMRLYRAEQRRADLYARLGDFGAALSLTVNECTETDALPGTVIRMLGKYFDWPFAALVQQTNGTCHIQAIYTNSQMWLDSVVALSEEGRHLMNRIVDHHRSAVLSMEELVEMFGQVKHELNWDQLAWAIGVPISFQAPSEAGLLVVGTGEKSPNLAKADSEVLEALAEHIIAARESLKLADHRRELARLEERNRLARDLHDSVNQMLFSLSLTARGVESMLSDTEPLHPAVEAMQDIRALSQEALKEMRALIMQLRPVGLEAGLLSALQEYGTKQGLQVIVDRKGIRSISRSVEEGLWRIGQEAINNIRKHSGVTSANILLELDEKEAKLTISDQGKGGAKKRKSSNQNSLGLSIMRERAHSLGGRLDVWSSSRKGTTVTAVIPLSLESE